MAKIISETLAGPDDPIYSEPARSYDALFASRMLRRRNEVPANLSRTEAMEYIKAQAAYQAATSGGGLAVAGWLVTLASIPLFMFMIIPGLIALIVGLLMVGRANRQRKEFERTRDVFQAMKALAD
jgi:hypothetical protein